MHDIRPYLPELFTKPGSLLYIGARPDAHSWLPELFLAGHSLTVLEVWPENTEGLRGDPRISRLIQGDVREIDTLPLTFDMIFWWHGPEHLSYDEIGPTLARLEAKALRLVALACPYGYYPQGAHKGNPYEEHKTYLYPEQFTDWGYEVRTDGQEDEAGSEIVAWKRTGQ
jgi:hypothetical protein